MKNYMKNIRIQFITNLNNLFRTQINLQTNAATNKSKARSLINHNKMLIYESLY